MSFSFSPRKPYLKSSALIQLSLFLSPLLLRLLPIVVWFWASKFRLPYCEMLSVLTVYVTVIFTHVA